MPSELERIATLENEVKHHCKAIEELAESTKNIEVILNDGMKDDLKEIKDNQDAMWQQLVKLSAPKNGSSKKFLGMKPEVRDKIIMWGIRASIFALAGKEAAQYAIK